VNPALKGHSKLAMGEAHRKKRLFAISPVRAQYKNYISYSIIAPLQCLSFGVYIIDGLHPSLIYHALSGLFFFNAKNIFKYLIELLFNFVETIAQIFFCIHIFLY